MKRRSTRSRGPSSKKHRSSSSGTARQRPSWSVPTSKAELVEESAVVRFEQKDNKAKRGFCGWKLEDVRQWLTEQKCGEEIATLDQLISRISRTSNFVMFKALNDTSCLQPCLDFLTAKDLSVLMRCSKFLLGIIRRAVAHRVVRVVGRVDRSRFQLKRQGVVPYTKGKKRAPKTWRRTDEYEPTENYQNMKVVQLRKCLKERGLSTRGRKNDLIEKLRRDDEASQYVSINKRDLRYLSEREFLKPFYVGQWVDAKDTTEKWLEAQVIDVDGDNVAIHYKGWKTKYDEWLDLSRGSPDWDRIARPLSRFVEHPSNCPNHDKFVNWLKTGALYKFTDPVIMAHDTTEKWVEATVIGCRQWPPNCVQVRVTYHGWDKKYDEWINMDSYRLAARPQFPPSEYLFNLAAADINDDGVEAVVRGINDDGVEAVVRGMEAAVRGMDVVGEGGGEVVDLAAAID